MLAPKFGPVSINLDLTTACNHRCPFCVDMDMLNSGNKLCTNEIKRMTDLLCDKGLKSVIVIGGGEPTIHKDFEEIIVYLKSKGLQLGIVTNGTKMDKIISIADSLTDPHDFVRLSLDAGTQQTFEALHVSRSKQTLLEICAKVKDLKMKNKNLTVGYSYIVSWEGCQYKGVQIKENITEMPTAVTLAVENNFDYVSFKPFLLRVDEDGGGEALYCDETNTGNQSVLEKIEQNLQIAEAQANDQVEVVRSLSMNALLKGKTKQIQPKTCHMQFFRQVVTSQGVFHCPAYRDADVARVGDYKDLCDSQTSDRVFTKINESIGTFDASKLCGDKFCFYNEANHWVDSLIKSKIPIESLVIEEDANFFF